MSTIHYEKHPVTPERKKELRAKGLRIIDIAFKPADAKPADAKGDKPEGKGKPADSKGDKPKGDK